MSLSRQPAVVRRPVRRVAWALFAVGLVALIAVLVLLRLTIVTDSSLHPLSDTMTSYGSDQNCLASTSS